MSELDLDDEPIFLNVMNANSNQPEPASIGSEPEKTSQAENHAANNPTESQEKNQSTSRSATKEPRIKCPECLRFTSATEEKMIRHIRKVHRGENPFQCYMCDYSTYNNVLFQEHVNIHKGIKPYKCSQCPYRSVSKKNVKKHELIHRPDNPRKCKDCDFVARHIKALARHRKLHDSANAEAKPAESTDEMYYCKRCSVKVEYRNIKKHVKSHRKCQHVGCNVWLVSPNALGKHKKECHGEDQKQKHDKVFNCSLCSWSSESQVKILLHLVHHPNQTVDENIVDISILREHGIMT